MVQKRLKLDFSLLRRRNHYSTASSDSISPIVPILESPITFQASTPKIALDTPSKQKNQLDRAPVIPSMFIEEREEDDTDAPILARAVPADGTSSRVINKSIEEDPMPGPQTRYFEDVFSSRGPLMPPRAQISQDSVIVIEIKLSTRVGDDETLVSIIASHMANIYQKPESCVMVTIQQGACLNFGNSKLPAYLTKVFALPSFIAPITNLRSTILIQSALQDIIHIVPSRGVVLYIPVSEENFATNSVTMVDEISRLERRSDDQNPGLLRAISQSISRRVRPGSSHSKRLSEATTSSWTGDVGTRTSRGKGSVSSGASEDERIKSVWKSKSLRQYCSTKSSDHGGPVSPM